MISWLVIVACVLVFLYQSGLTPNGNYALIFSYGVVPARLLAHFDIMSLVTSLFLHGGFLHLGSNMLYLWIFGDNVEDAMGHLRFLIFYVICGCVAALTQALIDPSSQIPLIGASGGIAGILGAYIMLYPRATIKVFMWVIIIVRLINIPAWIVLSFWIGGQFLAVPDALANQGGGVAYFAHIGGFIAGMVLVGFFKKPDVRLFAPLATHQKSWQTEPPRELGHDIKHRYILEPQARSGSVPSFKRRRKGPWDN